MRARVDFGLQVGKKSLNSRPAHKRTSAFITFLAPARSLAGSPARRSKPRGNATDTRMTQARTKLKRLRMQNHHQTARPLQILSTLALVVLLASCGGGSTSTRTDAATDSGTG